MHGNTFRPSTPYKARLARQLITFKVVGVKYCYASKFCYANVPDQLRDRNALEIWLRVNYFVYELHT